MTPEMAGPYSCLWCGDPIPADRMDDDFCSDVCHWQAAEEYEDPDA